jgi:hypothetical protein
LRLHPGEENDELEGNLICGSVNNNLPQLRPGPQKWDAVSYTWGHAKESSYIKIIAEGESWRLPITPNLELALRHLRYNLSYRVLWIDALCIDQNDGDEKSLQIPRMSELYRKAELVVVWLGEEDEKTSLAISHIRNCVENVDKFDDWARDANFINEWDALCHFLKREWFVRRWIVQEIANASRAVLYCGEQHIEWDIFMDMLTLFRRNHDSLRALFEQSILHGNDSDKFGDLTQLGAVRLADLCDKVFSRADDKTISSKQLSLESLISSMPYFLASDPKDQVYSLLWMANDAHPVSKTTKKIDTRSIGAELQSDINALAPSRLQTSIAADPFSRPPSPLEIFPSPDIQRQSKNSIRGNRNSYVPKPCAVDDLARTSNHSLNTPQREVADIVSKPGLATTLLPPHSQHQSTTSIESSISTLPPYNPPPVRKNTHIEEATSSSRTNQTIPSLKITSPPRSKSNTNGRSESSFKSAIMSPEESIRTRYAGLMLTRRIEEKRFVVDYSKSTVEVFRDAIKFCVHNSKSLDLLCFPWAPNIPDLSPSWICQLSSGAFQSDHTVSPRRINGDPFVGRPGFDPKIYCASRNYQAICEFSEDNPLYVKVRGYKLGVIGKRTSVASGGSIPRDWLQDLNALEWTDHKTSPPTKFWRTLVGNRTSNGEKPHVLWQRICKDAFKWRPPGGDLDIDYVLKNSNGAETKEFLDRLRCVTFKRRLIQLEEVGHIGLGPELAKKGDIICILFGCSVPVLLRKYVNNEAIKCSAAGDVELHETDDVHYEVVGEAYVHGYMEGEAYCGPNDSIAEDFLLR